MLASKPGKAHVSIGALLGVFLLAGAFCLTLAMADGAIYLRTMMPVEPAAEALPQEPDTAQTADADTEQWLIDLLYQDDQDIVYQTVQDDQRWHVVRMRVTAYCACAICCGKWSDGITACNHRIRPGDTFVASDPMYRFGTEMIVPGYNQNQPVEVKDRGRVIKGNRLDVFFDSHETAKKWGTRHLDVLVREK